MKNSHSQSVGIKIGIDNYEFKDTAWLEPALKTLIISIVGEESFAYDIQYITSGNLPEHPASDGFIEIKNLLDYIDWKKTG